MGITPAAVVDAIDNRIYDIVYPFYIAGVIIKTFMFAERDLALTASNSMLMVRARNHDYDKSLLGETLSLVDWDHAAGTATACWDSNPDACAHLTDFYPRCSAVYLNLNGKVKGLADSDGHVFPINYFTPNGTVTVPLPSGDKIIQADWILEVKNETLPWSCADHVPSNDRRSPSPITTNLEGREDIDREELLSYFSALPDPRQANARDSFAKGGAKLILHHLTDDDVAAAETFRAVMSKILETHSKSKAKRSLWKRATGKDDATLPGKVMHATLDAVHATGNAKDRAKHEVLGVGAMVRASRERLESEDAQLADFDALNKAFSRARPVPPPGTDSE